MKKITVMILMMLCILVMAGCGQVTQTFGITIPAGSTGEFVYSEEEISPTGNTVTISAGEGLTEAEIILKTIEVKEETAYMPEHLTPDAPVTMDVEKGAWFQVGVSMMNESDEDLTVHVDVEGVKVRTK